MNALRRRSLLGRRHVSPRVFTPGAGTVVEGQPGRPPSSPIKLVAGRPPGSDASTSEKTKDKKNKKVKKEHFKKQKK